jgi:hypothetical protein
MSSSSYVTILCPFLCIEKDEKNILIKTNYATTRIMRIFFWARGQLRFSNFSSNDKYSFQTDSIISLVLFSYFVVKKEVRTPPLTALVFISDKMVGFQLTVISLTSFSFDWMKSRAKYKRSMAKKLWWMWTGGLSSAVDVVFNLCMGVCK